MHRVFQDLLDPPESLVNLVTRWGSLKIFIVVVISDFKYPNYAEFLSFLSIGCSWRGWCFWFHWTKSEFLSLINKTPNYYWKSEVMCHHSKISLVCASLRVNVVSLVREEALALRVSRDQEDFQELPVLMDLRWDPHHISLRLFYTVPS